MVSFTEEVNKVSMVSFTVAADKIESEADKILLVSFTVAADKIESEADMPLASISVAVVVVTGANEVLVDRVKDVVGESFDVDGGGAGVSREDEVLVDRVEDVIGERFDVDRGGAGVSREDDVCAEDLVEGGKVEVVVWKDAVELGGSEPAGHQRR